MNILFPDDSQQRFINSILADMERVGYRGGLVEKNYGYSDEFARKDRERRVDAALFGRTPTSFETALFGIVGVNGLRGIDLVNSHRSLGAPLILEVEDNRIGVWTIGRDVASTTRLFQSDEGGFQSWLDDHKHQLRPDIFLRSKEIKGGPGFIQGDLFAGWIPELEEQINNSLGPILERTFKAGIETYQQTTDIRPSERQLFKLGFWLLTGKVFADRGHPDFVDLRHTTNPDEVLRRVASHYNKNLQGLLNRQTRDEVFGRIWNRMDFRHLSVEVLSQIWSRTLVTKETRKKLGIHRTRRSIVRYIIDQIPFDDFAVEDRRVLELCTGSAAFLIGAMDRMRDIVDMHDSRVRHTYFQRMLKGIEKDDFGVEIASLCLALADYPNANGWSIEPDDVFRPGAMLNELTEAKIVLCNPPFEKFTDEERVEYKPKFFYKPADLLSRVLKGLCDPQAVLGFVLPRAFLDGQDYREVRPRLVERFGEIDLVSLPDKGWEGAAPETVLLTAKKPRHGSISVVTHGIVRERNWREFEWSHGVESRDTDTKSVSDARDSLAIPELRAVWEFLSYCPRLEEYAEAHKGVEWNVDLGTHEHLLVSDVPLPESRLGVPPRSTFNSFERPTLRYLNFENKYRLYDAFGRPWDQPKVIMKKTRRSRDMWRVAAFADFNGLACFETFFAIWPRDPSDTVVLEAVLNGPIANAFLAAHCGRREFSIKAIHKIPFPMLSDRQVGIVNQLVSEYKTNVESASSTALSSFSEADRLLREIDAAILTAYGLPPRLERRLLDFFNGSERLVPFNFGAYFPPEFKPFFSLRDWLTGKPALATAERFRAMSRDVPLHIRQALRFAADFEREGDE